MKYTKYLISLSLFLLLSASGLFAKLEPIIFKNISHGLSQSTVTAIAEDEYGFLWIGTEFGLNRYDGVQFKQFHASSKDSTKLRENYIKCLHPDKKGNIWIGTFGGGLHRFDIKKERFYHYSSNEFPSDQISNIFQLNDKELLVAAGYAGLLVFDITTEKFRHYNENKIDENKLLPKNITSIDKDQFGNIWVGTIVDGLARIDSKTQKVEQYNVNLKPENENTARTIEISHDGRVWVGTNNGLLIGSLNKNGSFERKGIHFGDSHLSKILNEVTILSLWSDSTTLWVGTENFGLFRISLETEIIDQNINNPDDLTSISGNSIWSIFKTKNNDLWVGGYLSGFNKVLDKRKSVKFFDKKIFENQIWDCKNISGFSHDHEQRLWYITDGNGLVSLGQKGDVQNYTTESSTLKLKSNHLLSIDLDAEDNIWLGSWGGGISVIDRSRKTIKHLIDDPYYSAKLDNCKNVHAIKVDNLNRIWVGAAGVGINVIIPESKEVVRFFKGDPERPLSSNLISTLLPDSKGNLWVGTSKSGLEKVELDQNLNILHRKSFLVGDEMPGVSIHSIIEKEDGKIIVGTSGIGIAIINPENENIQYVNSENGLPSDLVYGLLIDNDGLLWGSSGNAIFAYDFSSQKVKTYYNHTGNKPNEFLRNSQLKLPTGSLLFGSTSGYCIVHPKLIEQNQVVPKVYLTNLSIDGETYVTQNEEQVKTILNNQKIVLNHNQNDLSIDFTSISFDNSILNQFQYQLQGIDDHWRNTRKDRFANYANLPPGNYTFKVKGSNSDGLWNEEFASMDIRIKAPWYQTNLAYVFYLLGTLILAYFIRRQTLHRLKLKNQLKLEQLEVEKMQELDQIKVDFFTNISHEFKTPLTLIMSPLASLMKEEGIKPENKELYKIIMKNSEYLNRLINQILDISRIESGNAKLKANEYDLASFVKHIAQNFSTYADQAFITFRVYTPDHKVPIFFDQEKMEKVLINILSNAFKFTPNHGEISIDLSEQEQFVEISVTDNGEGIEKENLEKIFERFYKSKDKSSSVSTGIGLALSKQLVNMHSGTLTAKSQQSPTRKTTFTIRLQKGIEHLKEVEIIKPSLGSNHLNVQKADISFKQSPAETIDIPTPIDDDDRAVVLVVEDNDDMRMFISSILSKTYKVIKAPNGKIGYEMALQFIPEIIISDVMMPDMNGYQLTKAIKENPLTCHIFMILLSAKASEGSISEGFKLGVDSYLTKPFNPNLLELKVKNLLQSRQQFKKQLSDTEKINLAPDAIPYSQMDEDFIKKIIGEIEKNISFPGYKVDDLCLAVGFSKSQLYRKLKGLTGKSIKEFVRMIRLKRAAQLLEQKDLRVSEITSETGFNDLQNFREAFKKQFGMSPKQYREKANV